MPFRLEELPPVLVGHHRHEGRAIIDPNVNVTDVPLALPLVPPERTLEGRHVGYVLTREEHAVYVGHWRSWLADHPEYDTADGHVCVHALCMAGVRLLRTELVLGRNPTVRTWRLLHQAYQYLQRLRVDMGATRRQRLAASSAA
jgi:hypothetical protein